MQKGEKIYYARIHSSVGLYEVYDLKIRMVEENWFSATDKRTQKAFIFSNKDIGKTVFFDRGEALQLVLKAEEGKKTINNEKYYEEY